MIRSLDNPPVVITTKRWAAWRQTLLRVLLLVLYVAGGTALIVQATTDGKSPLQLLIGALLLLAGLAGVANHIRVKFATPPRISLSPDGIGYDYLSRHQVWHWDDVSGFRKVHYRGADWVGFDVAKPVTPNRLRDATGADYALLSSRAVDDNIDHLTALFTEARERWKSDHAPISVKTGPPAWPQPGRLARFTSARIGRVGYWVGLILPTSLLLAAAVIALNSPDVPTVAIVCGLLTLVGLYWLAMLVARRFRDIGIPPFFAFPLVMMLAPVGILSLVFRHRNDVDAVAGVLAVVAIISLPGIIPGYKGDNAFGPPPAGSRPG